ncbi:MAG: phosphatase PAP2 family protein [Pirellulaceae bacterium]
MMSTASTPLSEANTDVNGEATGNLQSYFSSSLLADQQKESSSFFNRLLDDQKNFYSRDSLIGLGLAFGAGAAVANTDWDHQIHRRFQTNVHGAASDEWFEFLHANKELGNGYYTLPVMGAAWLISETIDGPRQLETLGDWGERSLRGFAVGAVPLVVMQSVTGASRPGEPNGSGWDPLQDDNGVSGHSFMSALPFITAAKLTNSRWKKAFWYSASAIGPLSRVNDNAHYPSQAGLGWFVAYAAASAVDQTATNRKPWSVVPLNSPGYSGAGLEFRW